MNYDTELAPIWKALSDDTRRAILDLLREKPRTTGELAEHFEDITRYAVMKHLGILEEANLIAIRREGRKRWNHLNAVPLQMIYERWLRPYEDEWANTLLTIKAVAEAEEPMPDLDMSYLDIAQDIHINASPERVFDILTQQTASWWRDPYVQRAGSPIHMEPYIGGRLFEDWGNGDGILLGTIVRVEPPEIVRLIGTVGIKGIVQGNVIFEIKPTDSGSVLKLSHRAFGEITDDVRSSYTGGWHTLLAENLKAIAETD